MKLKAELMDKVIQDLEVNGAKVKVVVEPGEQEYDLRTATWIIDAKWKSGQHWRITSIINEIKW